MNKEYQIKRRMFLLLLKEIKKKKQKNKIGTQCLEKRRTEFNYLIIVFSEFFFFLMWKNVCSLNLIEIYFIAFIHVTVAIQLLIVIY